jgi:hypothetical protein
MVPEERLIVKSGFIGRMVAQKPSAAGNEEGMLTADTGTYVFFREVSGPCNVRDAMRVTSG